MALLKQLCDEQHIATLRRLNALYKASKLAQHDMRVSLVSEKRRQMCRPGASSLAATHLLLVCVLLDAG